jgi:predicted DNA-binding transcriptional regulator YafY
MAGVPIFSQQGRNGGWRLAGGGRTDLSGLTAGEARALFLVAGPSSSSATPQVKAALRKLLRALPEPLRSGAEAASAAVVIDPGDWDDRVSSRPAPPLLDAVQHAVVEGEQIHLAYVARNRQSSTRIVHPLGLAAKGTTWYLVADTDAGLRTFRVDRMTSVRSTGEPVVRPPGFQLREAWQLITDEIEQRRTPLRALALAHPHVVPQCRWMLGNRVRIGPAGADGRVEIELRGHTVESLAGEIAGLGGAVEVVDPPQLRDRLARLGSELAALYKQG